MAEAYSLATILAIAIPLGTICLLSVIFLMVLTLRYSSMLARERRVYNMMKNGDFRRLSASSSFKSTKKAAARSPNYKDHEQTLTDILCCIPPSVYSVPEPRSNVAPEATKQKKRSRDLSQQSTSQDDPAKKPQPSNHIDPPNTAPTRRTTEHPHVPSESTGSRRGSRMKPMPLRGVGIPPMQREEASRASTNAQTGACELQQQPGSFVSFPVSPSTKTSPTSGLVAQSIDSNSKNTTFPYPYAPGPQHGPLGEQPFISGEQLPMDLPTPPAPLFQSPSQISSGIVSEGPQPDRLFQAASFEGLLQASSVGTGYNSEDFVLPSLTPPAKSALRPKASPKPLSVHKSPSSLASESRSAHREIAVHNPGTAGGLNLGAVNTPSTPYTRPFYGSQTGSQPSSVQCTPMVTPSESLAGSGSAGERAPSHLNLEVKPTSKASGSLLRTALPNTSQGVVEPRILSDQISNESFNIVSERLSEALKVHELKEKRSRDKLLKMLQRDESIQRGSERRGRTEVGPSHSKFPSFSGSVVGANIEAEPFLGPRSHASSENIAKPGQPADSALLNKSSTEVQPMDSPLEQQQQRRSPNESQQYFNKQQTSMAVHGLRINTEDKPSPSSITAKASNQQHKDASGTGQVSGQRSDDNNLSVQYRTQLASPLLMSRTALSHSSRSSSLASESLSAKHRFWESVEDMGSGAAVSEGKHRTRGGFFGEDISLQTRRPGTLKTSTSIRDIASLREPISPRSPGYQPGQVMEGGRARAEKKSADIVRSNRRASTLAYGSTKVPHQFKDKPTSFKKERRPRPKQVSKSTRINKPLPSTPLIVDEGVLTNFRGKEFSVVQSYTAHLADELDIAKGDIVKVYEVFDDGWCLCRLVKSPSLLPGESVRGVCPRSCLGPNELV